METDSLSTDPRLLDLVVEWEESRENGAGRSLAELCAGSPELLVPLQQLVERLAAVDRKLTKPGSTDETRERTLRDEGGNAPSSFPPTFPGFEVLEEIGRGGMGIVYKARQLSVGGRLVAIKTIQAGALGSHALARRLKSEVDALGRLNHEHVVKVYDVIDRDGHLSLVLEYVDGASLAGREAGIAMPPREAAQIAATIAATMADVHRERILHRDLKPGNILRSSSGQIKITDFGLAKQLAAESSHSQTGDIAGSPSYMAPEQALGKTAQISERTDVYAIGATLYDLLTGRPPFVGATLLDTLDQLQRTEPISPRLLVPQIPRDLETVCLKCLEKEPQRRYENAADLARDLDNFLAGRSVTARPVTALHRGWRWTKRHPERAGLVAAVVVGLLAITGTVTWYAAQLAGAESRIDLQKATVVAEGARANTQEFYAKLFEIRDRRSRHPPGWTWGNRADLEQTAARLPADDSAARHSLRSEMARTYIAGDVRPEKELLEGIDAYTLTFSPDGTRLAVGPNLTTNDTVEIILLETNTWQRLPSLGFAAVVTEVNGQRKPDGVRSLAFTPDGRALYVGSRSGMIHAFDLAAGLCAQSWKAHDHYILQIRFSPDGNLLHTASEDKSVKSFTLDGRILGMYQHPFVAEDLAVLPAHLGSNEPQRLAVIGDESGFIRTDLWRLDTDMEEWSGNFLRAALYPDRRALIRASSRTFEVFDWWERKLLRRVGDPQFGAIHSGLLSCLEISSDGRWLVSCASDAVKLWDLPSLELVASLPTGGRGNVVAQFHPTTNRLAVCADERVTIFELSSQTVWRQQHSQAYAVDHAALSPAGDAVAVSTWFDGRTNPHGLNFVYVGATERRPTGEKAILTADQEVSLVFSPDGRNLAGLDHQGERLWLINPAHPSEPLGFPISSPRGWPRFSPDGRQLYFAATARDPLFGDPKRRPGELRLFDVERRSDRSLFINRLSEERTRRSAIHALAVGERYLVCSSHDGLLHVLAAGHGKELHAAELSASVDALALAPDESFAVAGNRRGELLVYDIPVATIRQSIRGHLDGVTALAFAGPNLVVSAARDRDLKLWQVIGGELDELLTLGPLARPVKELSASRDGRIVAVLLDGETTVRLLDLGRLRDELSELYLD